MIELLRNIIDSLAVFNGKNKSKFRLGQLKVTIEMPKDVIEEIKEQSIVVFGENNKIDLQNFIFTNCTFCLKENTST